MDQKTRSLLIGLNAGIIKIRGAYAAWSKEHGINYHELLILYSLYVCDNIRTQKAICSSYGIPKQTINNLIRSMTASGYICMSQNENQRREKTLELTEKGAAYAKDILTPLIQAEQSAISQFGTDLAQNMIALELRYGSALEKALKNSSESTGVVLHEGEN